MRVAFSCRLYLLEKVIFVGMISSVVVVKLVAVVGVHLEEVVLLSRDV